ncbi:hypothetical protein Tco_0622789, partial [Tanacetum coccineum]
NKALIKDEEAEEADVHLFRSIIGLLMYLTASKPNITFSICACARDSPFDLKYFSNSDYAGASLDRKSTTGGCQFLGKRLISWQCKKQTIVANSTTKAEYVVAANCWGQVLWIKNQMLDYGFNFMNTKIFIDNESTICIVKNPVFHSKTKHIETRHHFIRDSYDRQSSMVGFGEMRQLKVLMLILEEIVKDSRELDVLNGSHIVDNGEQEINATVDCKEFTITEASIRRHLQLADSNAEEGEGSGNPSEPQPPPFTAQPTHEELIPNIESSSP